MEMKHDVSMIGQRLEIIHPLINHVARVTILDVRNEDDFDGVFVGVEIGNITEICRVHARNGVLDEPCEVSDKDKKRIRKRVKFARRVKDALDFLEKSGL